MAFSYQDVPGPPRDLVGYGRNPPRVRWPNDARVAVSLIVAYEEGSEYSYPAGDGRSEPIGEFSTPVNPGQRAQRDLCVESVWEYGSRAGIWRIARILDEFQLAVTFFVSAVAVELNPEVGN